MADNELVKSTYFNYGTHRRAGPGCSCTFTTPRYALTTMKSGDVVVLNSLNLR